MQGERSAGDLFQRFLYHFRISPISDLVTQICGRMLAPGKRQPIGFVKGGACNLSMVALPNLDLADSPTRSWDNRTNMRTNHSARETSAYGVRAVTTLVT
jgi:hypothetical protein